MEWLIAPLSILAIAVCLQGWPSFITHNHYYNKEDNDGE
jgi:hypothetical protein